MKVTIHSSKLRQAADFAVRTAPAKPNMPILGCARLTATGGTLIAGATDYDVWGRSEAKANVITAGEVAVSARLLREIADTLPEGDVDLVADGSKLLFTAGKHRASAPVAPVEDFPVWPDIKAGSRWVFDGPMLARVLAACDDVCSSENTRDLPLLSRLALYCTRDGLRIETTDRYRGYDITVPWAEAPADLPDPTVATFLNGATVRGITALAKTEPRLLMELPADGRGLARFGGVGVQLLTRLADADVWPVLAKVMPARDTGRSYTVDTDWLVANLDAAGKFTDRGGAVRVTVNQDGIDLSAATEAAGSLDVVGGPVTVSDNWGDEQFRQGFNSHYLAAAVKATGAEAVTVQVTKPGRPVLITVPDGVPAPHTTAAVVMPIRLND